MFMQFIMNTLWFMFMGLIINKFETVTYQNHDLISAHNDILCCRFQLTHELSFVVDLQASHELSSKPWLLSDRNFLLPILELSASQVFCDNKADVCSRKEAYANISSVHLIFVGTVLLTFGSLVQPYNFTAMHVYPEKHVLILKCPNSGSPLQSKHNEWVPIAFSLHWVCPYIEFPYSKQLL